MNELKQTAKDILDYFFDTQQSILNGDEKYHKKVKTNVEKIKACTISSALYHKFTKRGLVKLWAFVDSSKDSKQYTVRLLSNGNTYCDCSDYIYRHADRRTHCKHIVAVAYLLTEKELLVEPLEV